MNTVGLEFMILHLFVGVFFDGFLLMLGILSVMRCLYAMDVCQRPQISTDHMRHISLERFENQIHRIARAVPGKLPLLNRGFRLACCKLDPRVRAHRYHGAMDLLPHI
jgi:hypothetical protein